MPSGYVDSLFENLYRAEVERKDKLDSQDALLVGAISIVGGVIIYWSRLVPDDYAWTLVINFLVALIVGPAVCETRARFSSVALVAAAVFPGVLARVVQRFVGAVQLDFWPLAFAALSATCTGYFVPALVSLLLSAWRRNLSLTANPGEIRAFEQKTRLYHEWYHRQNKAISEARTEEDVQQFMRDQLARCAEANRASNLAKARWQMLCRCLLVFAVIFAVANAVPTAIMQRRQSSVQKVEVVRYPGQPMSVPAKAGP